MNNNKILNDDTIRRDRTAFDNIGYALKEVEEIRRKKEVNFIEREQHRDMILEARRLTQHND